MKTKDVIHYLEGIVCLAEIDSSYIDEAVRMIKAGEDYVDMWNIFKHTYGHRTTYNSSGDQQLCRLEDIMNKTELKYFPKSGTKKEELVRLAQETLDIIRELDISFIKFKDKEEDV